MRVVKFVRNEPLLLFMVIAAILFIVHHVVNAAPLDERDGRSITINRDDLLRFYQLRGGVFDGASAGASLDAMPRDEQKELLASLIQEEALYREALSWGLDKGDYVLRRRMVQSLEFAVGGNFAERTPADKPALRSFYEKNKNLYFQPPAISFTHVFFALGKGGMAAAKARATSVLRALNAHAVDAASTGDRFLYLTNYVDQGAGLIESHFGKDMASKLLALAPGDDWHGPFESPYGVHLVKVADAKPGGVPPYEEVSAMVARDAAQSVARKRQQIALQKIIRSYRVNLAPDLQALR